MMKSAGFFIAFMAIMSLDARADFYKYKDSSGALVITDKLENVPKKYRNQFKVVWDADLEAKDPLAKRRAQAKILQEKQEQQQIQQKGTEKKADTNGKRVVITINEETGQLIRTLE